LNSNARGTGFLPGHLGIRIISVAEREIRSELDVKTF